MSRKGKNSARIRKRKSAAETGLEGRAGGGRDYVAAHRAGPCRRSKRISSRAFRAAPKRRSARPRRSRKSGSPAQSRATEVGRLAACRLRLAAVGRSRLEGAGLAARAPRGEGTDAIGVDAHSQRSPETGTLVLASGPIRRPRGPPAGNARRHIGRAPQSSLTWKMPGPWRARSSAAAACDQLRVGSLAHRGHRQTIVLGRTGPYRVHIVLCAPDRTGSPSRAAPRTPLASPWAASRAGTTPSE